MFKFPPLFAHQLKFKVVLVNFITKFPYIPVFRDQTAIKRPKPLTLYILKVITFIWLKGRSVSVFKQTNWKNTFQSHPIATIERGSAEDHVTLHSGTFFWILGG